MVEFFQNIGSWFVEHKDEIVVFFTSTNFVSFISAIVLLVKQIRATKNSTLTVNGLSKTLEATNKLASDVGIVSTSSENALRNTDELKIKINTLEKRMNETLETLQDKLNAIMEVQSIVYSGFKDDTARKNISNILTSAKLSETSTRVELEHQIEDLKTKLAGTMQEVVKEVEHTAENVKKTVAKKPVVSRY